MFMEKINWPNNNKCAAMISVNLDAELFWLQLDPSCVNMPKTLSMGQYGMSRGLERILDVFDEYKVKATFFVPAKIFEMYPDKIKEIIKKGHEISCHGYEHENLGLLSYEEQKEVITKSYNIIKDATGKAPLGFRAPEGEITKETLELISKIGFKYSSNLSDDDRPYWIELDNNKLLEIPIHWPLCDLPYFAFNYKPAFPAGQGRIARYSGVLSNWKDEFYGYHEYGLCYVLQVDPQTIGNPGRIAILEEILEYISEFKDTWFATGSDIYNYFNEK